MSCFIRTFTGIDFDIENPTSAMFDIRDIAHSLAMKCRFSGHTKVFYSVAQHCLYCSAQGVEDGERLELLLHEIGEAYLADVPTPIKQLWSGFKAAEDRILSTGLLKFTGSERYHDPFWIHNVDRRMLTTEAHQLMRGDNEYYSHPAFDAKAYDIVIEPLGWQAAEALFLTKFEILAGVTV